MRRKKRETKMIALTFSAALCFSASGSLAEAANKTDVIPNADQSAETYFDGANGNWLTTKTPLNISWLRSMETSGLLLITGEKLKMNQAGIESISPLRLKERK